jgi:hypothetical protein
MLSVEVEPLALADATGLIKRLFVDNGLPLLSDVQYEQVAQSVDCIAFYIHHVVSAILKKPTPPGQVLDMAAIEAVISNCIASADNPWDLQHYEERTLAYYGAQRGECLALLDAVASSTHAISVQEAIKRAKAAYPTVAQQDWIELTRLLERDHYFQRDAAGDIGFKFTVVKRWWVWQRSLATGTTGDVA